jgi:prepilin-type N-terminal cleavage/methylation domain-containing protein
MTNNIHQPSGQVSCSGFTLVELMISLAVLGILLTGGYSAMRYYTPNEDVRLIAHQLQASFMMARSEAVKRNSNAFVTPAAGGYGDGWIISTSAGRSYTNCAVAVPPDDCIYVFQNDRPVLISGLAAQVAYNRQGRIPFGANFTIEICDSNQSSFVTKRVIGVNATGFPKITTEGDCAP